MSSSWYLLHPFMHMKSKWSMNLFDHPCPQVTRQNTDLWVPTQTASSQFMVSTPTRIDLLWLTRYRGTISPNASTGFAMETCFHRGCVEMHRNSLREYSHTPGTLVRGRKLPASTSGSTLWTCFLRSKSSVLRSDSSSSVRDEFVFTDHW